VLHATAAAAVALTVPGCAPTPAGGRRRSDVAIGGAPRTDGDDGAAGTCHCLSFACSLRTADDPAGRVFAGRRWCQQLDGRVGLRVGAEGVLWGATSGLVQGEWDHKYSKLDCAIDYCTTLSALNVPERREGISCLFYGYTLQAEMI
jgi:hypothetical protein